MKTMKLALLAVAAMVAASCVKETAPEAQDQTQNQPSGEVNYVQMEFTVNIPTKTTLGEDGKTVIWKKGDAISVFDNSTTATAHNNMFTVVEGGASTAVVTGSVPGDATEFYAFYPYSASQSFVEADAKVGNIYLKPIQPSSPGTFPDDYVGMMAKADADGNFEFKNVYSHIKFTLVEDLTDISTITLVGNNGERLAGYYNLGWNDGDPKPVWHSSNSMYYIDLTPASGDTFTPGDYYFTLFPQVFESGFTVVLTRANGEELSIRTTKSVDLSKRNNILPMKVAESKDYKKTTNYFVKYQKKQDVTIGGVTINKTTHSKYTVVNDKNANTKISSDGLYFVDPAVEGVVLQGSHASYMVIGMEAGQRIPTTLGNHMFLTDGGTTVLLSGLSINIGSSYSLIRSCPKTFGDVVINDCKIYNIQREGLFDAWNGNPAESAEIQSLRIENSEIGDYLLTKQFRLFQYVSTKSCHINNYIFKNNVVYLTDLPESSTVIFRLALGTNLTMSSLCCENNTFSNVQLGSGLFSLSSASSENLSFKNNLFQANVIDGTSIVLYSTPSGGTVENNYFYNLNTAMESDAPIYLGSAQRENLTTYNAPFKLAASPLHETLWDPANDVYGPYSITPAEGVSAPTEEVGAYRDGMDTEAVSMLNSPSANYSTANIGKF